MQTIRNTCILYLQVLDYAFRQTSLIGPAVCRARCVQGTLCAGPAVCRARCVQGTLCAGPAVCRARCVQGTLCAGPAVCMARCMQGSTQDLSIHFVVVVVKLMNYCCSYVLIIALSTATFIL